jgi:hypothetical protein
MKKVYALAAISLGVALLVSACAAGTTAPTPEPTPVPTDAPAPVTGPKPEPSRIEFKASDGQELVGTYFPARLENAPVVVLIHWGRGDQKDWQAVGMTDWLQNWPESSGVGSLAAPARQGLPKHSFPPMPQDLSFAVFTIDLRGFGESKRTSGSTKGGPGWILDAEAAYAAAATLPGVDPERVAGIGASFGADSVTDGCKEGCLGALAIAAGSYLGVDYGEAVKTLEDAGKPAWCIVAENDGEAAPVCKAAGGTNYKMTLYPTGGHAMELFDPALTLDPPIGQVILDFLDLVFKN